jgi:Fur family ferric uptake transcriptional regulator
MAKRTEQRKAILEALRGSATPQTAQELHERLPEVGLATVYRNLQRLAAEGEAESVLRESGERAFLICINGHHHHLTCRNCGRVEVLNDCRFGDWAREVGAAHGFQDVDHRAELVGICGDCAALNR